MSVREEVEKHLEKLTDSDVATIEHNLGIICSSISCIDCPLMIEGVCLYSAVHDAMDVRRKHTERRTIKDYSDDELLNELITRYDTARNGGK